jgi:hypothetical protein
MKIHPDQLEGVRADQTSQTNRTRPTSTAFGDFLSQEVDKSNTDTAKPVATLPPPGGLGTLSTLGALLGTQTEEVQSVEATAQTPQAETAIMNTVGNLLDKWDQYAQNLQGATGTPNQANLKQAYGVLNDIDGTVKKLKGDNPDLASTSPALSGMVSEIEVMAVTERIKFNRGDYS